MVIINLRCTKLHNDYYRQCHNDYYPKDAQTCLLYIMDAQNEILSVTYCRHTKCHNKSRICISKLLLVKTTSVFEKGFSQIYPTLSPIISYHNNRLVIGML